MDDLISVIVPVYNAEQYLPRCVESILNQTYRNIELILINDGSEDSSPAIAEKYIETDYRVRVISSKNQGVSTARNLGLDNAKGVYFTFVDADDFLTNNAIEILYDTMRRYQADITVAKSSNTIKFDTFAKRKRICNCWTGDEALKANLCGNPYTYGACANLYRMEMFREIRFPVGKRVHEDSFYIFQCLLLQPKVITQETELYYYCNNIDSASHEGYSDKYLDIISLAKQKILLIREKKPNLLELSNNIVIRADLSLLVITCRGSWNRVSSLTDQLCKEVRGFKRYYVPCSEFEKKLFLVVNLHLFWFFRIYYRARYHKKRRRRDEKTYIHLICL